MIQIHSLIYNLRDIYSTEMNVKNYLSGNYYESLLMAYCWDRKERKGFTEGNWMRLSQHQFLLNHPGFDKFLLYILTKIRETNDR